MPTIETFSTLLRNTQVEGNATTIKATYENTYENTILANSISNFSHFMLRTEIPAQRIFRKDFLKPLAHANIGID